MAGAVKELITTSDVLIMAAAPVDFRPAAAAPSKIKKSAAPSSLKLQQTTDILASTVKQRRRGSIVVGFALETDDAIENGKRKLREKQLDLVVVNDASEPGAGFEVDTNRVTLIDRSGATEVLPLLSKPEVADAILDRVERLANGR
jgi:phosphopantothenoylcysteine decarboxylase/phosphopantothenate--cysteine ligase